MFSPSQKKNKRSLQRKPLSRNFWTIVYYIYIYSKSNMCTEYRYSTLYKQQVQVNIYIYLLLFPSSKTWHSSNKGRTPQQHRGGSRQYNEICSMKTRACSRSSPSSSLLPLPPPWWQPSHKATALRSASTIAANQRPD